MSMGSHMKTTIDVADALLPDAKRLAEQRGTTLRALVEEGLRIVLQRSQTQRAFRLPDATFYGDGLAPAYADADWPAIRAVLYEDRGA